MSRAKTETDHLEQEVFCALEDVDRKLAHRYPFEELAAAFEDVGKKYVPLLEAQGETWKAQELRRRVAESILLSALTTGRRLDECEELLERIIELGFTDLLRKAQVLSMFCGYWARRGSTHRVLDHLLPLMAELETEYARTGEAVWANYLRTCQEILDRIERRRTKSRRERG